MYISTLSALILGNIQPSFMLPATGTSIQASDTLCLLLAPSLSNWLTSSIIPGGCRWTGPFKPGWDHALHNNLGTSYAMAMISVLFKPNDNKTVPESLQQWTTAYEHQ